MSTETNLEARVAALEALAAKQSELIQKMIESPALKMCGLGAEVIALSKVTIIPQPEKRGGTEHKPQAYEEELRRGQRLREIAQELGR